MKYWTSILAGAALMALGAPASFAASVSHPWDTNAAKSLTAPHSAGAGKGASAVMLSTRPQWV